MCALRDFWGYENTLEYKSVSKMFSRNFCLVLRVKAICPKEENLLSHIMIIFWVRDDC